MIRRTLLVSLLLVCGLVLRAPAQSFTCGAVVAGRVTCTFGGGVTFNVPHDTVPKFIHDTVTLPAPPPITVTIHDTLPPKIVNHYCTLTGSLWDCSALTPPVVIVPPPPPPPPPSAVLGSVSRRSPVDSALTHGSFYLS